MPSGVIGGTETLVFPGHFDHQFIKDSGYCPGIGSLQPRDEDRSIPPALQHLGTISGLCDFGRPCFNITRLPTRRNLCFNRLPCSKQSCY